MWESLKLLPLMLTSLHLWKTSTGYSHRSEWYRDTEVAERPAGQSSEIERNIAQIVAPLWLLHSPCS